MKVSFKTEALLAPAYVFNDAKPALDVMADPMMNAARTRCTFILMLRTDFNIGQ